MLHNFVTSALLQVVVPTWSKGQSASMAGGIQNDNTMITVVMTTKRLQLIMMMMDKQRCKRENAMHAAPPRAISPDVHMRGRPGTPEPRARPQQHEHVPCCARLHAASSSTAATLTAMSEVRGRSPSSSLVVNVRGGPAKSEAGPRICGSLRGWRAAGGGAAAAGGGWPNGGADLALGSPFTCLRVYRGDMCAATA